MLLLQVGSGAGLRLARLIGLTRKLKAGFILNPVHDQGPCSGYALLLLWGHFGRINNSNPLELSRVRLRPRRVQGHRM